MSSGAYQILDGSFIGLMLGRWDTSTSRSAWLKRKRLAQQMTSVELGLDVDVTPDKVNKMIAKGIEAQKKADQAAKRRHSYNFAASTKPNKQRGSRTNQSPRRRQHQQRSNRNSTPSSGSRQNATNSSLRKSSPSRRHQSQRRA